MDLFFDMDGDVLAITHSLLVTQLQQLCHYLKYSARKSESTIRLETGILITSIDVDVGSKSLGLMNKGRNDAYVNNQFSEYQIGTIEETALPLFLDIFDQLDMPVTIAFRGQFFELEESVLAPALSASVKHDIGSHGYSHRSFTDLSLEEADNELNTQSLLMKKMGLVPKSFVYPRNKVAHLNLLERHGYKCYRDRGGIFSDGMFIKRYDKLYDIHPSIHINQKSNNVILKKVLEICVRRKLPLHMWFHLWNFGHDKTSLEKSISGVLLPFLEYASKRVENGELTFETMLSAIDRLEVAN